jgi:hypothetical protein
MIENTGESILFTASNGTDTIALPLVLRAIPETLFFDATSVYGYGGPVFNKPVIELDSKFVRYFKKEFVKYLESNKVISVFCRLHPLCYQGDIFSDFGTLVNLNKTVSINLTITPEEQWKIYRKSSKPEINKLRRIGYEVVVDNSTAAIDAFINIYFETMDKLDAKENYYFSREYLHSFIKNTAFDVKLLVAKFEGQIVAGAIFTVVKDIMQYHLAGTKSEFARDSPMKLIIDEARLLGNTLKIKYLHLGGGTTTSEDDSLFRFKSSFSKDFHQFTVWKFISNKEQYDKLVEDSALMDSPSNFFPLYRLESQC